VCPSNANQSVGIPDETQVQQKVVELSQQKELVHDVNFPLTTEDVWLSEPDVNHVVEATVHEELDHQVRCFLQHVGQKREPETSHHVDCAEREH